MKISLALDFNRIAEFVVNEKTRSLLVLEPGKKTPMEAINLESLSTESLDPADSLVQEILLAFMHVPMSAEAEDDATVRWEKAALKVSLVLNSFRQILSIK